MIETMQPTQLLTITSGVIVGGVSVMKNMSRANRRHHRARMIKRALHYWVVDVYNDSEPNNPEIIKRAAMFHNHLAACSCTGCGNQRHNEWLPKREKGTMQERRAKDKYKYELIESEII